MHGPKVVGGWRQMRRGGKRNYEPARKNLRLVKTVLAARNLRRDEGKIQSDTSVEVLFDSSSQWRFDGIRAAGKEMRHLLYRVGTYRVDVQIEVIQETNQLAITGQLLHAESPDLLGSNVQVSLSSDRKVVHLITNEFGEFYGELEDSDDLRLYFRGRAGKTIVIPLLHP